MRIAIVDDDETTIAFIAELLASEGHRHAAFRTARDAINSLTRDTFDLVLLDWNLPDMSGIEVLSWVRSNVSVCPPVIMQTSRSDKDDIAAALLGGADDFIVKPESAVVIMARIEAVLRRTSAPNMVERMRAFGPYSFDRMNNTVAIEDEPVALTAKEFALAETFFANLNRPLSRRYLMEAVWQSVADLSTRTLDMHVSRLRTKLRLSADNGYRLQTVFGYGYRLESFV